MTEHRPFPPSPRRLALARQAGLVAASPIVVGGVACAVAIAVALAVGRAAASTLGEWIAAACDGRASLAPAGVAIAVIELIAPIAGTSAVVALAVHVAQVGTPWSPRRRIDGAPAVERSGARAVVDVIAPIAIAGVAVGWLWTQASRLAALVGLRELDPGPGSGTSMLAAAGTMIASLIVALAVTWIALGTIDALLRRAELARGLAMTATEKREDDRLGAADPRWRAQRTTLARAPAVSDAVAGSAVVLLGDDVAVAVAWDAIRRPVPTRVARGTRAHATQLVGLARRHRVAVHRDVALAAALATADGPVPELHWARLAEIVAAIR
jgi:flagellar biosynthesis protein FlhB